MEIKREVIVVKNIDGKALTTSRQVAEIFNKNHNHVRRDIKDILEMNPKLDTSFKEVDYKDSMNRTQKEYLMDRDGFSILAMGFTGKDALEWKMKYVDAFNKMEEQLKSQVPQISEKEQMLLKLFSKDPLEVAQAHNRIVEIEVEEATQPLIETIEEQKPEVEFATRVQENNEKVYSMAETAKLLKLPYGNKTLFAKLRDMSVLRNNNEPFQTYVDRGYFILKISDTGFRLVSTTKVTGKGLRWLEKKMDELIS